MTDGAFVWYPVEALRLIYTMRTGALYTLMHDFVLKSSDKPLEPDLVIHFDHRFKVGRTKFVLNMFGVTSRGFQ